MLNTSCYHLFLTSPLLHYRKFVHKYHVLLTFVFPITLSTMSFILEMFNKTMYLATEQLSLLNQKPFIFPHLDLNSAPIILTMWPRHVQSDLWIK